MKLEYHGRIYDITQFTSRDPEGKGLLVKDIGSGNTLLEVFRDETEQRVVFNSMEFNTSLEFVELIIGMFDHEIGRKFEPAIKSAR